MTIHCQIDSIVFRNGRCFGWGWFLDPEQPSTSLELIVQGPDGKAYSVACLTGGRREDVGAAFADIPHAAYAGFTITGSLPGLAAEPVGGEMVATLRDGTVRRVAIPQESLSTAGGAPSGTGTPLWHRALGKLRRDGWRDCIGPARQRLRQWWDAAMAIPVRAWLEHAKPSIHLVFDHAMGGGANRFANTLHARLVREGGPVLYVVPVLHELRYQANLSWRGHTSSWKFDEISTLLDGFGDRQAIDIHVNELVSFHKPLEIVRWCTERSRTSPGRLTFYLHDFHAVCPSWTLIGLNNRFCGIPATEACASCLPHNSRHTLGYNGPGIPEWREAWAAFIGACDGIVAFSLASVELLRKAYPGLRDIVEVRPHEVVTEGVRPLAPRQALPLVVAVAGHVNVAKGALVLGEMSRLAKARNLPMQILVFGTLEEHQVDGGISVLGEYRQEDLPALFESHGVNMALLPSVCPETFSFVTSEYMAMDLPVAVFPIGAPAERVAGYPKGLVISRIDPAVALDEIMDFAEAGFRRKPAATEQE